MRSRLAFISILATGMLMSTGGAALGVTALSTTESAGVAQYGTTNVSGGDTGGDPIAGGGDEGGVGGETDVGNVNPDDFGVAGVQDAQAPRQLESTRGGSLPFTGYAAIPLLLVGIALLATGFAIRHRTRRSPLQM